MANEMELTLLSPQQVESIGETFDVRDRIAELESKLARAAETIRLLKRERHRNEPHHLRQLRACQHRLVRQRNELSELGRVMQIERAEMARVKKLLDGYDPETRGRMVEFRVQKLIGRVQIDSQFAK